MINIKIKHGYVKRKINDRTIVVPIGEEVHKIKGIIELNDSASFLWDLLMNEITESELIDALGKKYSIDKVLSQQAVNCFLEFLADNSILEREVPN